MNHSTYLTGDHETWNSFSYELMKANIGHLWKITACFVAKATKPWPSIVSMANAIKRLKSCRTCLNGTCSLISYEQLLIALGESAHIHWLHGQKQFQ